MFIVILLSGYSDADRHLLIDRTVQRMEERCSGLRVVDIPCNEFNSSAHSLLVHAADSMVRKHLYGSDVALAALKRSFSSSGSSSSSSTVISMSATSGVFNLVPQELSPERIKLDPLRSLCYAVWQLNAPSTNSKHAESAPLVIVLRHCEMLSTAVLNDLLYQLQQLRLDPQYVDRTRSVQIFAFVDSMCALPFTNMNPSVASRVELATAHTPSPWDLYDAFVSSFFEVKAASPNEVSARHGAVDSLPFLLAPSSIMAIHTAFEEVELCITSAVQR